MARAIRTHLGATVAGFTTLFLCLSGGAAIALDGSNTVFSDDISNGEVKSVDVGTGQVKTPDIAPANVTEAKLAAGAVTGAKVADGAIATAKLLDGAITTPKLADGAVNGAKVLDSSLTGADVANTNSLRSPEIGGLTGADIDESTLSGVPSGPPSGPAGGDLSGTYPNPTVAGVWRLGGNTGTGGSDFLGTTDNQPLTLRVNGSGAMRLEPASDGTNPSPNVVGGSADNSVTAGVFSATIGGGGRIDPADPGTANRITDSFGTVGGGANNQAGDASGDAGDRTLATVGGGANNRATGDLAAIGGGAFNVASGTGASVGGGRSNTASGDSATAAGVQNQASGQAATVAGGQANTASGSGATVVGGVVNTAQGDNSLAAGLGARAQHNGAFVWADTAPFFFDSTAQDQFSVRATGGSRFVSGVDGSGGPTSGLELPGGTTALSALVNGQPLDLRVNGARGLRVDPASDGTNQSPNVIGGTASNAVTAGVHSATIGGGGRGVPGNPATANRVTDSQGVVGGGANNQAGDGAGTVGDRTLATVGGGGNNTASGEIATVAGGFFNTAGGNRATVAGGESNVASGLRSTVGGGLLNTAAGLRANVDGGQSNGASGTDATIGGGANGFASGLAATIPGGSQNEALGDYSLAGGRRARAGHSGAFVWGDSNNFLFQSTAANQFSVRATGGARFVSGIDGSGAPTAGIAVPANASGLSTLTDGQPFEVRVNGARAFRIDPASDGTNQSPNVIEGSASNSVPSTVHSATIGGGGRAFPAIPDTANSVTDNYGTVGGGAANQAGAPNGEPEDQIAATVAGGSQGTASGLFSTVGGGVANIASGEAATVAGGGQNKARGARSTVIGGYFNDAEGAYSVVGGRFAHAAHDGAIVLADSSANFFSSTADNQFSVRSTGGARFVSAIDGSGNPAAGVTLAPGAGSWSSLSDETSKTAIEPVSGRSVLRALADVPISTWSYRAQDKSIRHIGPMAQDFYRAFGVGESRRRISSVDADGVALAAIQGLARKLRTERHRRRAQDQRLDRLEARLAALERDAGGGSPR